MALVKHENNLVFFDYVSSGRRVLGNKLRMNQKRPKKRRNPGGRKIKSRNFVNWSLKLVLARANGVDIFTMRPSMIAPALITEAVTGMKTTFTTF